MSNPTPVSERVASASLMSFSGMKQRIDNLWPDKIWLGWITMLIPLAWMFIAIYYVFWLMFVAVGGWIIAIPMRLLGRGRRKRKREELRHRETMAALQAQQQSQPQRGRQD